MATLSERAKAAGLTSASELTRITGASKETLTNWLKDKPQLFEIVLKGATANIQPKPQEPEPPAPDAVTQHTQTTAFSYEELQEQAKLIERLQAENALLNAELQIKNREIERLNQKLKTRPNALIGKQFTFCWNGINRVIRRTEEGWRYREEGKLKESNAPNFVNDKFISCRENVYFIDLGEHGNYELKEF